DGQFHRVAAGLPDPALDRLGPLAQVHVAGVELVPGVDDPDDGFAHVLLGGYPQLAGPRPMAEGPQSVGAVPLVAAQLLRTSLGHRAPPKNMLIYQYASAGMSARLAEPLLHAADVHGRPRVRHLG